MKNKQNCQKSCLFCRNYLLKNRSFGHCKKLNVSVRGRWKACEFYLTPFEQERAIEHFV